MLMISQSHEFATMTRFPKHVRSYQELKVQARAECGQLHGNCKQVHETGFQNEHHSWNKRVFELISQGIKLSHQCIFHFTQRRCKLHTNMKNMKSVEKTTKNKDTKQMTLQNETHAADELTSGETLWLCIWLLVAPQCRCSHATTCSQSCCLVRCHPARPQSAWTASTSCTIIQFV